MNIILPVLFKATDRNFTTNGLGILSDALYCVIQHEINGTYEMEMTYPVDGLHFDEIKKWRLIYSPFDETGNRQLFEIYRITKPFNGRVNIYAWHVSYKLNHFVVKPFTASSVATAVSYLKTNELVASEFTYATDKDTFADMKVEIPTSIRSLMGGMEGSFIDTYGGEWDFDNFTCTLRSRLGRDSGVTIAYGKNLTDLNADYDVSSFWTAAVGYWKSEDDVIYSDVRYSGVAASYPELMIKTVDASMDFSEKPTKDQLNTWTQSYVDSNAKLTESESIDISFVQLWQTEEYKNVAPLQRVSLGDTVHIDYPQYGISGTARVVSYRFNVLLGRYDSMTLGNVRSNLSNSIRQDIDNAKVDANEIMESDRSFFTKALEQATELITGGLGGYVVINTDANGHPNEILVMNTPDKETATRVMRINYEGIAFGTGYNGPFNSAWTTLDGTFNAQNINVINLSAASVITGILRDKNNSNYWNLDSGEFRLAANTVSVDNETLENYTKDVANGEITTFADTVLASDLENLQEQIDDRVITWYKQGVPTLSNAPANGWTNTETKDKHIGDLYFDTDTGKAYIFAKANDVYSWDLITDERITEALADAAEAQDTADGKRRVFITRPVPPYDEGDLWCEGAGGDIKTCTTAKASDENYSASDWSKLNKYTDDTAVTALNNALTQQEIFNRLTNNGTIQGIYMYQGQLYINATYIVTGRIASKNGYVYFDLDNDEIACSKLVPVQTWTSTTSTVYKTVLQIKYLPPSGSYIKSYLDIFREGYEDTSTIRIAPADSTNPYATIMGSESIKIASNLMPGLDAYANLLLTQEGSGTSKKGWASLQTYNYASSYSSRGISSEVSVEDNKVYIRPGTTNSTFILNVVGKLDVTKQATFHDGLTAYGTKNRLVATKDYDDRLLYCYEMPSPMFGDIGEAVLDESGECLIDIDDIFNETVTTAIEYQVFLQKEGQGDCWIEEKKSSYFVIKGTPNLKVAWEIKAKQRDYEYERLEKPDVLDFKNVDYEIDDYEDVYTMMDGYDDMPVTELIELEEGIYEAVI